MKLKIIRFFFEKYTNMQVREKYSIKKNIAHIY